MVRYLILVGLLWYLLRGLAVIWAPARRLMARLSPYTARLHAWVLSAPATFMYMAIFTASTVIQRSAPTRLIELLTTLQSTNLTRLSLKPVIALVSSALWVADQGAGLLFYLAAFGIVVAWAERRYGTPRMILICVAGHVAGTLITASILQYSIDHGLAAAREAHANDVGVSYMMVSGCGAALLLMRGRMLALFGAAMTVGVVLPVVVSRTIWDWGHLITTLCGVAVAWVTLRFAPPRVIGSRDAAGATSRVRLAGTSGTAARTAG